MIEDFLILAPASACGVATVLQGARGPKYVLAWPERQREIILFWRGISKSGKNVFLLSLDLACDFRSSPLKIFYGKIGHEMP